MQVGWYCTNSMSRSGTPWRNASAIPSPVTMPPLVFSRNTRPAPPVAMITAFASISVNPPVAIWIASTPWQRPSSTIRSVQKYSSKRLIDGYLIDVWNSVCSMWKPVLSAANQVRSIFMPPKARTLARPSAVRLQAIVRLRDRGGPAFGRHRVAAHWINLGDKRDRERRVGLGHGYRSAKPGPARADDRYI